MIETMPNLYFGTTNELQKAQVDGFSVVNLSGSYHRLLTHLPQDKSAQKDPNYIQYEAPHLLSLNFIDGPKLYYDYEGKGVRRLQHAIDFIFRELLQARGVLIVCDRGEGRSPTLAMLYEAHIRKDSFEKAVSEFKQDYPQWKPKGMLDFIHEHWNELV